ncbi:unnamed protein product [Didymodactylos carnosus]|uniref:Uncharacterized protein n=1 Tax=Didymodactylos carnosus TaxID=1234261 RepID=A0A814GVW4_9BILA|nr:unnamed protein product [Didymodactylos carnosus]CAF3773322.1 unnamed protein product [Didymodactylos carnosus]
MASAWSAMCSRKSAEAKSTADSSSDDDDKEAERPQVSGKRLFECEVEAISVVLGLLSSTSLQILSDNPHWNADGTFRTSPKLFYQNYGIRTWDEFSTQSVVYTILLNKEEVSYQVLLNALTNRLRIHILKK